MIDYISIVSEVVDAKKKVNNVYINFLRQKKGPPPFSAGGLLSSKDSF